MKRGLMKVFEKPAVLGLAFTLVILIVLLVSGSANALILGLVISDNEVEKGEVISFLVSAEIEEGEIFDVDFLVLRLMGPKDVECKFSPDLSIIEGCIGISIQEIQTANYSYGYGFTKGKFIYNITLDTTPYPGGVYESEFGIKVGGDSFFETGDNIIIRVGRTRMEGCSIRADDGEVNNSKNRFSLNIPLGNAADGQGYLYTQSGRERRSHKFKVVDVLFSDENDVVVLVEGRCKIGRDIKGEEEATIYLDKVSGKVSIESECISIENMDVTFIKGC